MELILIILILVVVTAVGVLTYRKNASPADQGSSLLMQQQVDALRAEVNQSLKNTSDTLSQSLKLTQDVVGNQLNNVTMQLSNVTRQLESNTNQTGTRLDNAAKVINEVQNKLGELGKATQEIKELGQSVSKLEEMLKAPKLRGGLGELLLEDLLKQILPANAYAIQHAFRSGVTVDAVIVTAGGKVPVDSKFPLENFRKMLEAKSEQDKKTATRLFRTDVKKHIDAISSKYIVPDEGTFDFALMYIPAENIYYETIIRDEAFADEEGLYSYATQRRVIPVSPNSFYAYLRVIALGLKGLQIERSAREIFQNLARLNAELGKFSEVFETLGTHLTNAKNNFDKADKQLNVLSEKFRSVQSLPEQTSSSPPQLDAFGRKN